MKGRLALIAVVALVAATSALADPAMAGYPSSIASTGDSMTRAYNTGFVPYLDAPSNSWATGSSGTVNSHYRRILAANPLVRGRTFNDAVSGADMADLAGQVQRAVSQAAEYVTAATFDFTDPAAPTSSASVSGGVATLTATDNVGVTGTEYRLASSGPYTRYTGPVALAPGATLTYRAVDVNGNVEATKTVSG